jgi:uncharacterized protein YjbJ (UPF0337 family)
VAVPVVTSNPQQNGSNMTDKNVDEVTGRVKEAAGVLTDDKSLKREGRIDQAKHTIKDAVDKVADKIPGGANHRK